MKPLFVLLISFALMIAADKLFIHTGDIKWAGRIGMSCMLVFTSIGHFAFSKGMAMMIPEAIPFKKEIVLFTGALEILAAIALHISSMQVMACWFLILFFSLILPANIYAALKRVDYQKGSLEGKGPDYLWFRIPLQIFFIGWIYFSMP